ncbi:mRNA-binding ribosome synthesis protein nop7 [Coemansia sp. RSA 2131]|nr:mRNA-binding ribosome synthesis protein nop7 [Coemansia sp. RSA 720]KAJ2482286.1 mRNA-binding ribosome synthesis protein nop7 [Coemansia sp. RSA 2131]KAJ2664429.1 mRNA-binding ribosome synthesis protein nop7 [Coemansia sp. RSA 1199]
MAKIKKKHTEGASRTYTTRNRALKKLQVSLADFRRLCILKGIYPVEPRSRKQANRGSTKLTTFYYSRDIQLLLSEPLIEKFRAHKVFLRKLQHALGKDDLTRARSMDTNRPTYTLNHLVVERYPAFADALRDLDDGLCMMFLFATMPIIKGELVTGDIVNECRRLSTEFMHYVIHTRALRKVFLSIKGIYYQAEVQGQAITWIVPYQFSQRVPTDVDFKVMATFLQFYRTLMGFVNYRLFTTANLAYPPHLDEAMDESGVGLGSLKVESQRIEDLISAREQDGEAPQVTDQQMAQRLQTLGSKLQTLVEPKEPAYEAVEAVDVEDAEGSPMFANHVIFLSREVPRHSLEFVLRAAGGRVGWDKASGGGSAYAENDRAITVQISDRPAQGHQYLDRTYVQPQWVYDSINAGRVLDTENYLVGQPLPAHLSPFVEYQDGDYVPQEAALAAQGFEGEVTNLQPEDVDAEVSEHDDGVDGESADESDADDEVDASIEKQYKTQLEAERAGVPFSAYAAPTADKGKKGRKVDRKAEEDAERQKIAISMLSSKKRKAVNRANAETYKRKKDVNALKTRKAQLAKH